MQNEKFKVRNEKRGGIGAKLLLSETAATENLMREKASPEVRSLSPVFTFRSCPHFLIFHIFIFTSSFCTSSSERNTGWPAEVTAFMMDRSDSALNTGLHERSQAAR